MAAYIQTQSSPIKRFYMDGIESIEIVCTGNPTSYTVESGRKPSDHYSQEQDSLSMSGKISNVRFSVKNNNTTNIVEWVTAIKALKESSEFFTVGMVDGLAVYSNCLFNSLRITQNTSTGKHSAMISMEIKQVEVAQQANIAAAPAAFAAYQDILSGSSSSKAGTIEAVGSQKAKLVDSALLDDTAVGSALRDVLKD